MNKLSKYNITNSKDWKIIGNILHFENQIILGHYNNDLESFHFINNGSDVRYLEEGIEIEWQNNNQFENE